MQRQIRITEDGSHTIVVPGMNVSYRSMHGAIRESRHVFIDTGLRFVSASYPELATLDVLEIGFGSGLNALLSLMVAEDKKTLIEYTALELFPLGQELLESLNYCKMLESPGLDLLFERIHNAAWEKRSPISPYFNLEKNNQSIINFATSKKFHLVYFDAFAPDVQPELWTQPVFEKLFQMMNPGAALVTYCSKGTVRRNMIAAGFKVVKLSGPPGKREIVRAIV